MSLSSLVASVAAEGGVVSSSSVPDGPTRRRSFTPAQKLKYLAGYEAACETGQGGAFLRREGLYSSLISEWRRQRDAGLLEGKSAGEAVGQPSREQAELARVKARLRQAEKERDTAEAALEIMGKLHALLEPGSRHCSAASSWPCSFAALIEREVRTAMAAHGLHDIALYPELRNCTAPSTERILEIFANVSRHHLYRNGLPVKTFEPELTAQQLQILALLDLPPSIYTQARN